MIGLFFKKNKISGKLRIIFVFIADSRLEKLNCLYNVVQFIFKSQKSALRRKPNDDFGAKRCRLFPEKQTRLLLSRGNKLNTSFSKNSSTGWTSPGKQDAIDHDSWQHFELTLLDSIAVAVTNTLFSRNLFIFFFFFRSFPNFGQTSTFQIKILRWLWLWFMASTKLFWRVLSVTCFQQHMFTFCFLIPLKNLGEALVWF